MTASRSSKMAGVLDDPAGEAVLGQRFLRRWPFCSEIGLGPGETGKRLGSRWGGRKAPDLPSQRLSSGHAQAARSQSQTDHSAGPASPDGECRGQVMMARPWTVPTPLSIGPSSTLGRSGTHRAWKRQNVAFSWCPNPAIVTLRLGPTGFSIS